MYVSVKACVCHCETGTLIIATTRITVETTNLGTALETNMQGAANQNVHFQTVLRKIQNNTLCGKVGPMKYMYYYVLLGD